MHALVFIIMLVTICFLLHPYFGTAVALLIVFRCVQCIRRSERQAASQLGRQASSSIVRRD